MRRIHSTASTRPNTLVIIPARNEADNLNTLLPRLSQYTHVRPVVIIDHAVDDTELTCQKCNTLYLLNQFEPGRSRAIQYALNTLSIDAFDWVVIFDADLQHDTHFFDVLPSKSDDLYLLKGSRFEQSSRQVNTPEDRRLLAAVMQTVIHSLTRWTVTDANCGLVALNHLAVTLAKRYCVFDRHFSLELLIVLYKAHLAHTCFKETPIPAYYNIKNARDHCKYVASAPAERFFQRANSLLAKLREMLGECIFLNATVASIYDAVQEKRLGCYEQWIRSLR